MSTTVDNLSVMEMPEPIDVLPHRPPFLFVTAVTAVEPGHSAAGDLAADRLRALLRRALSRTTHAARCAHDRGVGPARRPRGRFSIPRYAGKLPLFGGIERARFRRQVVPGDTLELEVTLERMSARAGKGHGTALVGGQKACETDLLFVIVESEAN